MIINTLPHAITPELRGFCASISSATPVFIISRPEPDAVAGHCFDNAAAKVDRTGGTVAYGWAIWHMVGLYFEAEHHAVWKNADGTYIDVSPQFNDYSKILFLPDQDARYDPDNFRPNICAVANDSAVAAEFVALANKRIAILSIYQAQGPVLVDISDADQTVLDAVTLRHAEILAARQQSTQIG